MDGEGVERGWEHINPLAVSTKEMGPRSRRDTLDDHFGDHNWKKTIGLGTICYLTRSSLFDQTPGVSLLRKIKTAVKGHTTHRDTLANLSGSVPPSSINSWLEQVEAWEKDNQKPNPYFVTTKGSACIIVSSSRPTYITLSNLIE